MNENDKISWEAYFSEKQTSTEALVLPAEMAIFPLFQEKATSLPMVKHGLKVICAAVKKLNGDQMPELTVDQPPLKWIKMISKTDGLRYTISFMIKAVNLTESALYNLKYVLSGLKLAL